MDVKKLMKRFENARFCYAKAGGQGFVDKSECICTKENPCQAKLDSERFHNAFEEMSYGDFNKRKEILEKIKPEFENSQWYKDNVVE